MAAYQFQEGQLERIEDILKMIDTVDDSVDKDLKLNKLILTLSTLGLTVAAIMGILKKRGLITK